MPRVRRDKSRSGIYHIMIRGANKQEIFHDDEDCRKFLETLHTYKLQVDMKIFAWCLMNNHVHLLVQEGNEDISISMKRIGISYVSYYHLKYETTGHLFQDRFRSEVVETDLSLKKVVRYIHQNPVKAGIVIRAIDWKWSSCGTYYQKKRDFSCLIEETFILLKFSNHLNQAIERFIAFNEEDNEDSYLDWPLRIRKTDEQAREEIKALIGTIEIAQVKSFPKLDRDEILRKVKNIDGISQRQISRILGISPNIIFKA